MPNPAYPTLPIDAKESKRIFRDGREEDVASDGATRVRRLHADKWDFELKHPLLTASEMTILDAFYASYADAPEIDFTWPEDGDVYVLQWGKAAIRTQWVSPSRRHAWVRLVAV
ncbi:MAG: hypothetical protein ACREBE_24010 [bacterium]